MNNLKLKKAFNLWFTGLPSSGKTTTAVTLKKYLLERAVNVVLLDGDEIRRGLSSDLGFSAKDREENNRRIIYITSLLVDQGIPVLTTFISPYRKTRRMARKIIANFIEIFIDTPIEECIKRDVKGLYAKAKRGELKGMTGIDDVYERPEKAELILKTLGVKVNENILKIIKHLSKQKYLNGNY